MEKGKKIKIQRKFKVFSKSVDKKILSLCNADCALHILSCHPKLMLVV